MNQENPPDLERYRNLLHLLAEFQLSPRLRVKEDASDIVQQTLWEAHRDLPGFRGQTEAELLAWLKTILVRNLYNVAREFGTQKRDLGQERSLAERLEQSSANLEHFLASEQTSPSQNAMQNERLEQLAAGLASLLEAERTALIMQHFQGCSLAEISQQIDRPIDAVGGLLKRGLKKLRSHFRCEAK